MCPRYEGKPRRIRGRGEVGRFAAYVDVAGRGVYRVPVTAWRPRLAVATVIQSRAPMTRGRAPALRSAATLVDRPIADSATETRNTDAFLRGECASAGMMPQELTAARRT